MNKITTQLYRLIYDPVKGRIIYDFLISFMGNLGILVIFTIFRNYDLNYLLPFYYSLFFLIINFTLGIYTKNTTAVFRNKFLILLGSNLTTYLFLIIALKDTFLISLFFLFGTITTVLPRFFLNFNVKRIKLSENSINKKGPILVVGGGGYIGSVLVEKLLKKGEKVRVFDKFIYSKNVFKKVYNSKNLELMDGDISDVYKLTLAVKDTKAIVHLAGIVGDPAAKLDEKLTRHVNIASTRLLKETSKAFGIERFIFASSCSVYGAAKSTQNENNIPKPISLYAKTKVDSEKELLTDRSDNFHPVILRFATVFGHSRKPRFDLVANLFVAEGYINNFIKVYGGDQWRPFVHVSDVAEAIIKALDAPTEKVSRQIFNVGDDKNNITIIDLAKTVKNVIGNPKIKIVIINKKSDKRNYRVSFNKIHNVLEFNSSITLEKGIKEIYSSFLNKKYKLDYTDSFFTSFEKIKELKKEFRSKKYKATHFSTIS